LNSGIFVLHAATFLGELACLTSEILDATRPVSAGLREDLDFLRLDR